MAWFYGQVSTVWPPERSEAMWMNTVDAPALIPVIHSAWETSSPLFKYSFQFLVALRSLIDLKKKKKKKTSSTENLSAKKSICRASLSLCFILARAKSCNLFLTSAV